MPMRMLVVGDTHANRAWWTDVVVPVAERVAADVIVQTGDFGYWPGAAGEAFVDAVAWGALPVFFADGNHENHELLRYDVDVARAEHGITDPTVPVPLVGQLTYLPRGGRARFGDVDVVALGGARSIDRRQRTPGLDWFLAEAVDEADLARVAAGGPAQVLLTHDAPSGYAIPGLSPVWELPVPWQTEQPGCEEHRERIREAMEAVRPRLVVHGHYHRRYQLTLDEPWGPVQVEGLDCDGTSGAFVVLDTVPELAVTPLTVTLT